MTTAPGAWCVEAGAHRMRRNQVSSKNSHTTSKRPAPRPMPTIFAANPALPRDKADIIRTSFSSQASPRVVKGWFRRGTMCVKGPARC